MNERGKLSYDPSTRILTVGARTEVVDVAVQGNEHLLRIYLRLVSEQRGLRPGSRFELRQADIEVLAVILDLDDLALDRLFERVLHVSAGEAAHIHRRLLRQRLVGAAAAVTVGVIAATSFGAGATAEPSTAGARLLIATAHEQAFESRAISVSLPTPGPDAAEVPRYSVEDDTVEIGTSVVIERDEEGNVYTYTSGVDTDPNDGVEIGDALVIERPAEQ